MAKKKSVLFNPQQFNGAEYDAKSRQMMLDTIAFFEHKGLRAIREDNSLKVWQDDWMKYQKEKGIFATALTAKGYGDDPDARFGAPGGAGRGAHRRRAGKPGADLQLRRLPPPVAGHRARRDDLADPGFG